jgi:hypothetical protein
MPPDELVQLLLAQHCSVTPEEEQVVVHMGLACAIRGAKAPDQKTRARRAVRRIARLIMTPFFKDEPPYNT